MAELAFPLLPAIGPPLAGITTRVQSWHNFDTPSERARWTTLAGQTTEPNPFHAAWYALPALRALDPAGSVQILAVEHEGKLIGVLPVRREPRYYGRPIPHMASWMHANSFLGTPLVAKGGEHAFWSAALAWADREAGRSLFLHLAQLPLEGPLYTALTQVLDKQHRFHKIVHREERAMLASDQSPGVYFETSLSGKKRKELRRQAARLAELGNVRCVVENDAAHLDSWIEAFLALEHSGWKGSAGSALASHHATASLFREALSGAASAGQLQRLSLWLDDEPVAMLVQFLSPPGAFSYKTAFDERFARFSPGVLLQRENLAILGRPDIAWCDSCATADHPMIDHIWRERRAIGRLSIAIGGPLRRGLFRQIARLERGRKAILDAS
ncbi:GNAT family N-acetyltransferase [Novosphingobium sp.]|uniref:GNAT family N-acetyltransferase n=1 Tax=Novosphingobium sp. TaxID=1874826 RepID=UPI0025CE81BF|nr:GNAT family N-acetyltransferase [Novosphingobium sp.]